LGAHARIAECVVERVAGPAAGFGDEVAVQVDGGGDGFVAQPAGYLGDWHAFGKRGAGERVPQIMEDLSEKYQQLLQLRAKKRLMEIEVDRMGDQEARLETAIKLAIGSAKGIDGVATWETGDSRRKFDSDVLKSADPELYEAYVTKFDQARFREERPDVYASCQRTHRVRQFRLIE
jgi:hypothetical protein